MEIQVAQLLTELIKRSEDLSDYAKTVEKLVNVKFWYDSVLVWKRFGDIKHLENSIEKYEDAFKETEAILHQYNIYCNLAEVLSINEYLIFDN